MAINPVPCAIEVIVQVPVVGDVEHTDRFRDPQQPMCAVAVVRAAARIRCAVHFDDALLPLIVESVIAPTDNWPLHDDERIAVPLDSNHAAERTYLDCLPHMAYGLFWTFDT